MVVRLSTESAVPVSDSVPIWRVVSTSSLKARIRKGTCSSLGVSSLGTRTTLGSLVRGLKVLEALKFVEVFLLYLRNS